MEKSALISCALFFIEFNPFPASINSLSNPFPLSVIETSKVFLISKKSTAILLALACFTALLTAS